MAKQFGRLTKGSTYFFMCDIQAKLVNAVVGYPSVISVARRMLDAGKLLEIPILGTEQYPQGLGPTVDSLRDNDIAILPKTKFSMCTDEVRALLSSMPQIENICLFGIEAHVCVQQTTLDLRELGYNVHLLVDGVSSRSALDRETAIVRMRQAGAFLTTSESVLFELAGDSKHPMFRDISKLIREHIPPIPSQGHL